MTYVNVDIDVDIYAVLDSLPQHELNDLVISLINDGYGPDSVTNPDRVSIQLYRMRVLGLDLEKTSIETLEELLDV